MNLTYSLFVCSLLNLGIIFQLRGSGHSNTSPFITTWKTDNEGTSCNSCITIPTTGAGYNYEVDWDNDGIYEESGITAFNQDISRWDISSVTDMSYMFQRADAFNALLEWDLNNADDCLSTMD